jgi:diguanylate cyclase (GGDEF)-like protein/PAS domain S-box-containing protein
MCSGTFSSNWEGPNMNLADKSFVVKDSKKALLQLENYEIIAANESCLSLFGANSLGVIRATNPGSLSPKYQPDGRASQLKANQMMQTALEEGYHRFLWVHSKLDGATFYAFVTLRRHSQNEAESLIAELEEVSLQDVFFEQMSFLFFEQNSDAVMVTDANTEILLVNNAFCRISGYSKQETIGKHSGFMKSGRHSKQFYEKMWSEIKEFGSWEGEIWDKRKNGEVYQKQLKISAIKDSQGEVRFYIAIFKDSSAQIAQDTKLKKLALYDALTNLPNRRLLLDKIQQTIIESEAIQRQFALLIVDLDNFKYVNDYYGHQSGDELLKFFASCINSLSSQFRVRGRLAGDEFLLAVDIDSDYTLDDAIKETKSAFDVVPNILGHSIRYSCSVGACLYPQHAQNLADMLKFADLSLYKAKETPGFSFKTFEHQYWDAALSQIKLTEDIKRGLNEHEFVPFYQPKFDTKSLKIHGFEALARWRHKDKGILAPAHFINIANRTKLDSEISLQILEKVCQFIASSSLPATLTISVNISPDLLVKPDFVDKICEQLERNRIDATQLEIEITENSSITQSDVAFASLTQIRALGIKVAIDDFGTGYASLGHLKKLPIDILKIDKLFIQELIEGSSVENTLVSSIVQMAKALNLKVVAEGVEHASQLSALKRLQCDMLQGFLLSKPIPEDCITEILAKKFSELEASGSSDIAPSIELRDKNKQISTINDRHSFEQLFENSLDSILITTASVKDPRILYANPAFCEMSGYDIDEIVNQSPRMFKGLKTKKQTSEKLKQALSSGGRFYGSVVNYRKDGSSYNVELKIHPIKGDDGKPSYYVSTQKDISAFRKFLNSIRFRSNIESGGWSDSTTVDEPFTVATSSNEDFILIEDSEGLFEHSEDLFALDKQDPEAAVKQVVISAEDFHRLNLVVIEDIHKLCNALEDCLVSIELAKANTNKEQALREFLYDMHEFANTLFFMDEFMDLCSALSELSNRLASCDLAALDSILIEILYAIVLDLNAWLTTVFVNRDAANIHALDDSIISSAKQIVFMLG